MALSNGRVVISSTSPGGPLMLVRNTTAINPRRFDFPGAESFGLYSCVIDGEEKDQSHRAVYR